MVDCLTLTVNARLARWLLFHHSRKQSLDGHAVWEKPAVYSLDDWLRQIWLASWPDRYFLTDLQSKHLWQKIIREDSAGSHFSLLHLQGAAAHASEAFQLINQYRLPVKPEGFNSYTEETKTFYRWMTRYRKQLDDWQALDPSELLDRVSRRMQQGHIPLPEEIQLYGFDDLSPQLRDWLTFLENHEVPVRFSPFEPQPVEPAAFEEWITQKQATVQKYEDANEEVVQCARWVRSIYKSGETIGIVVPDLENYRGIIEREFKAELAPKSVFPWEEIPLPFNISLGTPLSHEPMVHLALLLLSQASKRIPLLTFSTLINSPFLKCPEKEKPFRRELDWTQRGKSPTHVYLPQILSPEDQERGPVLTGLLKALEKKWMDDTAFRLPSQWARKIANLLKELEWPAGSGTLSSHQYQALESWKSSLDSLATLDRVSGKINRHQAVANLTHIVGETLFQPQTHEEPIQVVGLLESAGMEFDHLWIMGCHADTLPPVPRPNPFLPFLTHQKPCRLPHSTAERELAFTEQTLYRLAHACRQMIFSFPAWKGEAEMVPSPLIAPRLTDPHAIHRDTSFRYQDHPDFAVPLETLTDFSPIPVSDEEKSSIRGGTGIIKHQALCPFQAFAVHRLSSQHREFSDLDMDEGARGSLIHEILELFWSEVKTSDRLRELHDSGGLTSQIHQCIEKGLQKSEIDLYGQKAFFELEKERLASLLQEWMKYELEKRGTFKIFDLEQKKYLQLNGLALELRVDRIDELDNGGKVIIDYKTGTNQNLKKWFGDRIEEPQLPLYSQIVPADALAFAEIRKGKSRYRGLSIEPGMIPGVDLYSKYKDCPEMDHWEEVRDYWKIRLDRTAKDFLDGNLVIDPVNEKETCKVCDQKTFCRKTELLSRFEGEDE